MDFELRRDKLRRRVVEQGVDALLVSSEKNVTYLSGFSGDSSHLLLARDDTVLVSDARYTEQIEQECGQLATYIRPTTAEAMSQAVRGVAATLRIQRLAFEAPHLTVSQFGEFKQQMPTTEFIGWDGAVEALRARKDAHEIAALREAIRFAEHAFAMLRSTLRPGDTEKGLADRMEMLMRGAGAKRGAFDTIIAVGTRAALPHARPGDQAIIEEVPLLVDWGASGPSYQSDLTRVLVANRIPAKLEAVYDVVLKAQRRAIGKIRPGVMAQDVDAEARATIEESGFGRFFAHSTGHGLGLEVHEAPFLRPDSQTVLEPGMVVTVEPGIYMRGWGGVRIEDDVLVTPDGHEVLSSLPKDLDSALLCL